MRMQPIALEQLDGKNNLLQSGFWGAHKAAFGWTPCAFRVTPTTDPIDSGDRDFGLLVLERKLVGSASLAYVPHGPDPDSELADGSPPGAPEGPYRDAMTGGQANLIAGGAPFFSRVAAALSGLLPKSVVVVRFDINRSVEAASLRSSGFVKASTDIQPPNSVIVNLQSSDDELLSSMRSKTRYNVRLSAKRGVEFVEEGRSGVREWYRLYQETAVRDGISIHSFEYYDSLFTLAERFEGARPKLRLYTARYSGRALAGVIVSHFGRRATYLYGASSNEDRNLMPAYGLQWHAMRSAKAAGCDEYDLFGIPPTDDPKEPMAGLYRFKTGFGGTIVRNAGCWDSVRNRPLYKLYGIAEQMRSNYYHKFRKRDRVGRVE